MSPVLSKSRNTTSLTAGTLFYVSDPLLALNTRHLHSVIEAQRLGLIRMPLTVGKM